jgi:hypothetical protein
MAMATAGVPPWHLRYRTLNPDGSPNTYAYKWDVVGGATPLWNEWLGTSAANTTGTIFTFIPNGASGTALPALPLSGDYMLEYGISGQVSTATQQDVYGAVHNQANGQITNGSACWGRSTVQFDKQTLRNRTRLNAVAASTILDIRGRVDGGGSFDYSFAFIGATPIRVG